MILGHQGLQKVSITFASELCEECKLALDVGVEGVLRQHEEKSGRLFRVEMVYE